MGGSALQKHHARVPLHLGNLFSRERDKAAALCPVEVLHLARRGRAWQWTLTSLHSVAARHLARQLHFISLGCLMPCRCPSPSLPTALRLAVHAQPAQPRFAKWPGGCPPGSGAPVLAGLWITRQRRAWLLHFTSPGITLWLLFLQTPHFARRHPAAARPVAAFCSLPCLWDAALPRQRHCSRLRPALTLCLARLADCASHWHRT